jgi:hypothetical protein
MTGFLVIRGIEVTGFIPLSNCRIGPAAAKTNAARAREYSAPSWRGFSFGYPFTSGVESSTITPGRDPTDLQQAWTDSRACQFARFRRYFGPCSHLSKPQMLPVEREGQVSNRVSNAKASQSAIGGKVGKNVVKTAFAHP